MVIKQSTTDSANYTHISNAANTASGLSPFYNDIGGSGRGSGRVGKIGYVAYLAFNTHRSEDGRIKRPKIQQNIRFLYSVNIETKNI
ncbi:unnamed protein product [Rotaria magnacalcarata]|uniref:Uncharacterized protein n=3 Tax=Rotaria magnacalcarata TaxID=392030 RepID=A0A815NF92_9BILA|nr:unnamed protein product [Rotaria magnacalcarata]CAF2131619.1 unnamed protein product [Rotaria magnacalcarata]